MGCMGTVGGGGGEKNYLPIPVECLDSNQAHSRQSPNRVIDLNEGRLTPVRWCDDDNAMMAKMTTTPYKTMDQNLDSYDVPRKDYMFNDFVQGQTIFMFPIKLKNEYVAFHGERGRVT